MFWGIGVAIPIVLGGWLVFSPSKHPPNVISLASGGIADNYGNFWVISIEPAGSGAGRGNVPQEPEPIPGGWKRTASEAGPGMVRKAEIDSAGGMTNRSDLRCFCYPWRTDSNISYRNDGVGSDRLPVFRSGR